MVRLAAFCVLMSLSTLAYSAGDYACRSPFGDEVEVKLVDTEFAPALTIKTDKVELKGYATLVSFADGSSRYTIEGSTSHFAVLTVVEGSVSLYWSLTSRNDYRCQLTSSSRLAD